MRLLCVRLRLLRPLTPRARLMFFLRLGFPTR
jgi:hypothetical protein